MPKTSAKSTKPVVNKLSIAGLQKMSDRKKTVFIAIVVGVIGVSSFFGYSAYQDSQLKAKAAGLQYWYNLGQPYQTRKGGVAFCKTAINSAYGPLWQVNMIVKNAGSAVQVGGEAKVLRNGSQVISDVVLKTKRGQTKTGTVFVSRILNDELSTGAFESNGAGSGRGGFGPTTMDSIGQCNL